MKGFLLAYSIGIGIVSQLESLPQFEWFCWAAFFCILLFIFFLLFFFKSCRFILLPVSGFLLGFCFAALWGRQALNERLPEAWQEKEFLVKGFVVGLPQVDSQKASFQLRVVEAKPAYDLSFTSNLISDFPKKISLAYYLKNEDKPLNFKTGDAWQLKIKVKRSRSFVNPKGYDFESTQLRRGIGASGYVRAGNENSPLVLSAHLLTYDDQLCLALDRQRTDFKRWILSRAQLQQKPLLIALLIGDTSLLSPEQWTLYQQTGTLHLIAISGLHLGFFALIGFALGYGVGRFVHLIWHKLDARFIGHLVAIICLFSYAGLAGFNIPTLRTLVMLSVFHMAFILKREAQLNHAYLLSLAIVLSFDPLATFDRGFWLSFIAVGLLIFYFSGRKFKSKPDNLSRRSLAKGVFWIKEYLESQWLMFVGLLVPLWVLTYSCSLSAPLANFIAIPLITFFVVPCLIFGCLLQGISTSASDLMIRLADEGAIFFDVWLRWLCSLKNLCSAYLTNANIAFHFSPEINALNLCLFSLSLLLIILPAGLRHRSLGLLGIFLFLCFPRVANPPLKLVVFDVGQGTSVYVQTMHHQLLYDTGPKYSENFDAGEGIIIPYLQSQGVNQLDTLVLSHNDQDHSGGLKSLFVQENIKEMWMGQKDKLMDLNLIPNQILDNLRIQDCHTNKSWVWDEVLFQWINYSPEGRKANNFSCVLLIEYAHQKILLTGDIEKEIEYQLLDNPSIKSLTVLLAPHHGSHTSSTTGFVEATHPAYVIFSAGYHNQHGHPHADVVARYDDIQTNGFNTATSGAVEFLWRADKTFTINEYRKLQRHYWYWDDLVAPGIKP